MADFRLTGTTASGDQVPILTDEQGKVITIAEGAEKGDQGPPGPPNPLINLYLNANFL